MRKGYLSKKYLLAVGQRYGRLTVESVQSVPGEYALFTVVCNCGERKVIRGCNVLNGNSKSCGCKKGRAKLPFGQASLHKLFSSYRLSAKYKKLPFSLTLDQLKAITSSPCHYCGSYPSQVKYDPPANGPYIYNGIDRIDNSLGYTPQNSVAACGWCNLAKNDRTKSEFLDWVARIAKFQKLDIT